MAGKFGEGALDDFHGGAGAPGDIIGDTFQRPGAVEMGGVKPFPTPDEADLVARLEVEKQAPAFLTYLNIRGEAAGHS